VAASGHLRSSIRVFALQRRGNCPVTTGICEKAADCLRSSFGAPKQQRQFTYSSDSGQMLCSVRDRTQQSGEVRWIVYARGQQRLETCTVVSGHMSGSIRKPAQQLPGTCTAGPVHVQSNVSVCLRSSIEAPL
jgi:hypothetical protein